MGSTDGRSSDGEGVGCGEEQAEGEEVEELAIDEYGRVCGTSNCGLCFEFCSLMCPLEPDEKQHSNAARDTLPPEPLLLRLQKDCDTLFGTEDSFWLPAGATPRCTFEHLAAEIFAHHTRGVKGVDMEKGGAEWWVQVRQAQPQNGAPTSIGFHWDKDEDMVDSLGYSLHPQLSTVTYLSSGGAPTMVCDCRAPQQYNDLKALYSTPPFHKAFLSYPAVSTGTTHGHVSVKHTSFDGQLLHGAPQELARPCDAREDNSSRYTFLVNIWLGHTPQGLQPLPDSLLPELCQLPTRVGFAEGAACRRNYVAGSSDSRFKSWFGPTGMEHEVSFGDVALPSTPACTLEVDLSREGAEGIVTAAPLEAVPIFSAEEVLADPGEALAGYIRNQVLLVKGGALGRAQGQSESTAVGLSILRRLYSRHSADVERTWNLENSGCDSQICGLLSAASILAELEPPLAKARRSEGDSTGQAARSESSDASCLPEGPWYASFVLNESAALQGALAQLPAAVPLLLERWGGDLTEIRHTANLWFFFGHNPSRSEPMAGRPEHTDKITHSGTWHAQQSGSKVWFLRPDAAAEWPYGVCPRCPSPLVVHAEPGDLLIVNTALWYHRTEIPCTAEAHERLSISYARDFYLSEAGHSDRDEEGGAASVEMGNMDDTWATEDVAGGTVIVEGPSALSFPQCKYPNCRILWEAPAGGYEPPVVVAIRDICIGESLTVQLHESGRR
mmetsp:Transcript_29666/g.83649  ORF Transcript_29666/g.83649 Transcript_29666/m.83649 type:complete len:726 (-) Transcript_29666:129-2306(-)|eukprot:CAMPEP_0117654908 /NCGR_PEP_ID=MMETSP0804-20121206/3998_1 /TAXON_ID=1074897 /ORGANISM="Tetraselmis astigmatica, Strain CCMP880" /LENGTH=725 /DNA_ID=CAMNT_0005461227 /DNA_START=279 /DNA_END=2459 /DNA_ORIENTATION=+